VLGLQAIAARGRDPRPAAPTETSDHATFCEVLKYQEAVTRSFGGSFRFVYLPEYGRFANLTGYSETSRMAILDCARRHGIPTVDLTAAFRAVSDAPTRLYNGDEVESRYCKHLSPAGATLIAEVVARSIGALPAQNP
jgi:hypothetical protein